MPKVLFIIHSLGTGGSEKVCINLADYLSKCGFEIHILTITDHIELKPLIASYSTLKARRTITSTFELCRYLLNEGREYDIVMSFSHQLTAIIAYIKVIFCLKFRLVARNINTLSREYYNIKSLYRCVLEKFIVKRGLRLCDLIICQSKGMADDLKGFADVSEKKINIINNPIFSFPNDDAENINPCKRNSEYFVFVGRLCQQKNIFSLLDVYSSYQKKGGRAQLLIVGDGNLRNDLEKYALEVTKKDSVVFLGKIKSPLSIMRNAKATLLTSHYEGFPNVLIESLSVSTPVISFDCPSGPSEIIINKINGYLIPMNDLDGFSNAMLQLETKKYFFDDILKTIEKFKLDIIGDKYRAILLSIAKMDVQ